MNYNIIKVLTMSSILATSGYADIHSNNGVDFTPVNETIVKAEEVMSVLAFQYLDEMQTVNLHIRNGAWSPHIILPTAEEMKARHLLGKQLLLHISTDANLGTSMNLFAGNVQLRKGRHYVLRFDQDLNGWTDINEDFSEGINE